MIKRNTVKLLSAAVVVAFTAPAFSADTAINVGALRFTSHAASFVAFERGYFKEEGLWP